MSDNYWPVKKIPFREDVIKRDAEVLQSALMETKTEFADWFKALSLGDQQSILGLLSWLRVSLKIAETQP